MTYRERLDELYTAAYKSDDINLALEIAVQIKDTPGDVVDSRIQNFMAALDRMVQAKETNAGISAYAFEYGGIQFKLDFSGD